MNSTRRKWFLAFVGALGWVALFRRPAIGQARRTLHAIDGTGTLANAVTGAKGEYTVSAPASGAYILIFREPKSSIRVLSVRQLTAATTQRLSVTIDLVGTTFNGVFNRLQVVEDCCALIAGDKGGRLAKTLFERFLPAKMREAIDHTMQSLNFADFAPTQRDMLAMKVTSLTGIIKVIEAGNKG